MKKKENVKESFDAILNILREAAHGGTRRKKITPDELRKMTPTQRAEHKASALASEKTAQQTNKMRKANPVKKVEYAPEKPQEEKSHGEKFLDFAKNRNTAHMVPMVRALGLKPHHSFEVQKALIDSPKYHQSFTKDPKGTAEKIIKTSIRNKPRDPRTTPSLGGYGNYK